MIDKLTNLKIFITGMHSSQKHEFMYYLEHALPQYLKVGRLTSTDPYYKLCRTYKYFSKHEVEKIFENHAFVFLRDGFGLLTNVFEESNLFTLSVEDFLLVPNKAYNRNDILVIWIDTDKGERKKNYESRTRNFSFDEAEESQMLLMKQFHDNLQGKNVMYFRSESPIEMVAKIIQYTETEDDKKRAKLLDSEFSR